MSEAELHVLQGRMHQGKLNKAARGALFSHPPTGYMRDPYQGLILDPDEQVRLVIQLIFKKFTELGSINAVTRYLRKNDICLGFHPYFGEQRGTLQWRRAHRGTVRQILRNPLYAGAYVYGRFPVDPKKKYSGRASRQRWQANPENWQVLLKDRLPAYITWEQFEKNCRQLTANYARVNRPGVPRNGAALLNGILRCAKCGGRMKEVEDAEAAHSEFLKQRPETLTSQQKQLILALVSDIPTLRHASTTQPTDQQTIIRLLVEEVVVDIQGASERFEVAIRWQGGYESRPIGIRPIHRLEQLHNYEQLRARAIELCRLRYSSRRIAEMLNEQGFRSPRHDRPFTDDSVNRLLRGQRPGAQCHWRTSFAKELREGEMWLRDLVVRLDWLYATLHTWVRLGWASARKVVEAGGMLALRADEAELDRLRQLRDYCRQYPRRAAPAILKTPRTGSS